jgi:hypothetical protein
VVCGHGSRAVPERDAITINLGDGFLLIAAGVRREKDGFLAADLMLQNGRILFADRAVLNTADGPLVWATKATTKDRPTAERMAEAIREYVLPDALKVLQEEAKKPTQVDELVRLVLDSDDLAADVAKDVELFHTPDLVAYASITVGDHRESWPVRSRGFRLWLSRRSFEKRGKAPGSQALADAMTLLEGKALFDGPECSVYTRLAIVESTIYLDLADDYWQAVEIDGTGWRIVANPPVKFRRTRGMLPLPVPCADGTLADLRAFVNVRSDDDWRLVLGWLIGAFRPRGPYAVLAVHGEQGSAKSTLARLIRALLDPNEAPIRSAPRNERDLAIAAANGWCLAFDNISHIPDWLSDAYCRLATGGGFATRTLYENGEETIFNSQRPIILNGIEEIATRGDLLDRAIIVYLPTIREGSRRTEQDLWHAFELARPGILAALLTVVAAALRNEAATVLGRTPRMADFARWVTAAEPALGWDSGAFLTAYTQNRREANDLTLDASLASQSVRKWAATLSEPWEGTATDLLKLLVDRVDDKTRKLKAWPDSGRVLSNALRRLAPSLRAAGVAITFDIRRHGGRRVLRIERSGG